MPQPMDYTLNQVSPLQSFNSAYTLGSAIKQNQDAAKLAEAQRMQAEAEAQRQTQIFSMFEKLLVFSANLFFLRELLFRVDSA